MRTMSLRLENEVHHDDLKSRLFEHTVRPPCRGENDSRGHGEAKRLHGAPTNSPRVLHRSVEHCAPSLSLEEQALNQSSP